MPSSPVSPSVIDVTGLDHLLRSLRDAGFRLIGPVVRDAAIVYDEIHSTDDLPRGWTDRQDAGSYRLERCADDALFGCTVGPHSWKRYLFPPRQRLWRITRRDGGFTRIDEPEPTPRLAFIGVRSCELAAIRIQDQVFASRQFRDEGYELRRRNAFILAVNCGRAGETCFCASMGTGPHATSGFDLALTELTDGGAHDFLVELGSHRGADIMERVPQRAATDEDRRRADAAIDRARTQMGRSMDTAGLPELLRRNLDHPHWEELAERCLSCANCTMVCPTCFCSGVEDASDLAGDIGERWRHWDSCFNGDFSFIHGGRIRASTASRYRQWMTHKLSTWHDQFGSSGCVGCGRCITWCPVGIDITVEAKSIRDHDGERPRSAGAPRETG